MMGGANNALLTRECLGPRPAGLSGRRVPCTASAHMTNRAQ